MRVYAISRNCLSRPVAKFQQPPIVKPSETTDEVCFKGKYDKAATKVAGGIGALVGGFIGFCLGGPIGAAAGAALGGGATAAAQNAENNYKKNNPDDNEPLYDARDNYYP